MKGMRAPKPRTEPVDVTKGEALQVLLSMAEDGAMKNRGWIEAMVLPECPRLSRAYFSEAGQDAKFRWLLIRHFVRLELRQRALIATRQQ